MPKKNKRNPSTLRTIRAVHKWINADGVDSFMAADLRDGVTVSVSWNKEEKAMLLTAKYPRNELRADCMIGLPCDVQYLKAAGRMVVEKIREVAARKGKANDNTTDNGQGSQNMA